MPNIDTYDRTHYQNVQQTNLLCTAYNQGVPESKIKNVLFA